MNHLALVLPLLTALLTLAAPPGVQPATVTAPQHPCAQARQIVSRAPCVRGEDCGALREWKEVFGAPGPEPLTPKAAAAETVAVLRRSGATVPRRAAPPSLNCLAANDAAPETPGGP